MKAADEVRRLKWTVLFVAMVALFATGHWVGGLIVLFGAYVEANSEPEL